ncbi:MAG: hypothetical protein K6G06_05310 [Butyrivibrio sp.]|nr:hypothetical protein [Butyrivibrio sp.]
MNLQAENNGEVTSKAKVVSVSEESANEARTVSVDEPKVVSTNGAKVVSANAAKEVSASKVEVFGTNQAKVVITTSGERWIDSFLEKSFIIKNFRFEMIDILFVAVLWVFAFLLRWKLFPIESADYFGFLELWMEDIDRLGGFSSLGSEISNYTSAYMYLMCFVHAVTDDWLTGLKMISVVFDYAMSIAVFLIVFHMTGKPRTSIAGMAFVLLSPTVFIDSAYWCQCDAIYSCFILYAIYFILKDKSALSAIMLGLAFCFKLQTVFILPFIVIMWLLKYSVKLIHLLLIPVVYVISIIPAWLFGRDFGELLFFYFDQGSYYPWGTLEYPNIYALLDETMPNGHYSEEVSGAGMFVAMMLLGIIAYYLYVKVRECRKNKEYIGKTSSENAPAQALISNEIFILTSLLTVAVTLYTLPHMHDRYGYLIDILAIIYACIRPKRIPLMCAFFVVSILTFIPYLTAVRPFSLQTVAVVMTMLIAVVARDLYLELKRI